MARRRRSPAWLGLLLAALAGGAVTYVALGLLAPTREVAGGPMDVASLEQRIRELETALADERGRPNPATVLSAPPAEIARREALEKELAATKKRLDETLARNDGGVVTELPAGNGTVRFGSIPVTRRFRQLDFQNPNAAPLDMADLARLLRSASEEDRQKAYASLAGADTKDALPLLQEALSTAAAGPHVPGLMSRAASLKDRPWSAFQATGAPDTPIGGDNSTAWAPKQQEMGEVTIDLEYPESVRVDEVRIHETFNPGAVVRVQAFEPGRGWEILWQGEPETGTAPRWFAPPVRRTTYATNLIRLVLDTNRVPGWNEIDAVELGGDGLRQWAKSAVASSSYAD